MENFSKIEFSVIARLKSDFSCKFGIPRQSGILKNIKSTIIFEPEFRNPDALRGLEGFSHLWILWVFSENIRDTWHPTVRPPRLGGNTRLGVFATRSSFRPNPIAMSCVKIEKIEFTEEWGPTIIVNGADLMDGTPILDIKPYLPFADAIENATGGFAEVVKNKRLKVEISNNIKQLFGENLQKMPQDFTFEKWENLIEILAQDPRPAYQKDPSRVYGLKFAGYEIKFRVENETLMLLDFFKENF